MPVINRKERFEKIPSWVLADGGPFYELKGAAQVVYVRLCALDRKHGDRRYAYVSMTKLAETCKVSSGSVSKAIAALVAAGMIDRLNFPSKGFAGMYGIVRFKPFRTTISRPQNPSDRAEIGFVEETHSAQIGFLGDPPIQREVVTADVPLASASSAEAAALAEESWYEG